MKHTYTVFFAVLFSMGAIYVFTACQNSYTQMYYVQQQQRAADKDGSNSGPTVDWEEDDDGMNGESDSGSSGSSRTFFSVIKRDGVIDETLFTEASTEVATLKAKLGLDFDFLSEKFAEWLVQGTFSGQNVPSLFYVPGNSWQVINPERNESSYRGPNSSAGSNSITDMVYYRYEGKNPLFAPDSSYNTAKYDGGGETFMNRFVFYRFTGKGGGVAALDNMLLAVDTYSKLVFAFAKPTKFGSLLGNQVPLEWGPVDIVSTGPGGKKYKFYEYDPAGYVTSEGAFVMYDWYMNGMARAQYDPSFTGKSPYLGSVGVDGGSGGEEKGYPVSGYLMLTAKYIKNVSMTDAWGDSGNADGTNSPEFIFDVRSRAYTGFVLPEWDSLSHYKPSETKIMPSAAKAIKVNQKHDLGGSKEYMFESVDGGLTLELDSRLVEVDISGNDWLTDYESPLIYFTYDRFTQRWKPTVTNNTYLRGPVQYDTSFSVGIGETKEFVIRVPAGSNETVELCYEIKWDSATSSEAGNIFSLMLDTLPNAVPDKQWSFSGINGSYAITYTDLTEKSSKEDVTVDILLTLGNLDPTIPILTSYSTEAGSGGLVKEVLFNGSHSAAIIGAESPEVVISLKLNSNPTIKQKDTFKIQFTAEGYDKTNSPKEIVVALERSEYIPAKPGIFTISDMVLKNISVMDVGGDQPAGGFDESEFTWHVRSRADAKDWQTVMQNTSPTVIKVGETKASRGAVSLSIENPREGLHTVYIDTEILEVDSLAGNSSDVITKFGSPLLAFVYNAVDDLWNYGGETALFFTDGNDNQWQMKKISMSPLKRGSSQTITLSLSAYISDTIWPVGNIADFINGPKTAGWGDMELQFTIKWE